MNDKKPQLVESPPDSDSIFGPSTLFGRAVAKLSRHVAFSPARRAAPPDDLDQQFRQELEAISSQMPSQFHHALEASEPDRGHHIVHGVAASGKTTRLCDHTEFLVKRMLSERSRIPPILVLCYNEPLAVWLQAEFARRGIGKHVITRHFHRWCREQLLGYHLDLPPRDMAPSAQVKDLVQRVIDALSNGAIPAGQYAAVLVDEAHDFPGAWLNLLTQLPAPSTNHLVLYFDDAQSMFKRKRTRRIRLDRHGLQLGNVQRLTLNHRNSGPIFNAALRMAGNLLEPEEGDAAGIPRLKPESAMRPGPAVLFFPMENLREQGRKTVELLQQAYSSEGTPWGRMAVLCDNRFQMDVCNGALRYQRIPHQLRRGAGEYDPHADSVKIMSLQACAGLEFELVVIVDSGEAPATESELEEKQRQLYIAATRARRKLYVVGIGKPGEPPRA